MYLHRNVKKCVKAALLLVLVLSVCVSVSAQEEWEVVYFDEQGRLSFEMTDIPATTTAYKTIGWTLKKFDKPIDYPGNLTVILYLQDESYLGEDNLMHTVIYVERNTILEKVAQCSEEWLSELRKFGGIAYLDNIMTISENGVAQGELYADGTTSGEVYNTYEGIAAARNWSRPSDLKQYFGRKVYIPQDEPVYVPTPPEEENVRLVSDYNYDNKGISVGRTGELYSDAYDVQQAVPALTDIYARGTFSGYGYRLAYRKVRGIRYYGVAVTVSVRLEWTEENDDGRRQDCYEDVQYTDWYEVGREYGYYAVDSLDFYALDSWEFDNEALGWFSVANTVKPELTVLERHSVTDPVYNNHLYYDAGSVDGGFSKPSVPSYNLQWLAEEEVGQIVTTSDCIVLNCPEPNCSESNSTAWNGNAGESTKIISADGVRKPQKEMRCELIGGGYSIVSRAANVTYDTASSCIYRCIPVPGLSSAGPQEWKTKVLVNPLTVHTPVVCDASVTDNKADNQRIIPEQDRASLILEKPFQVYACNEGRHIEKKGYQTQNYNRFVRDNEVCFPFPVSRTATGQTILPGTWISIGKYCENNTFYLPVTVDEGNYSVAVRTRAVNEQTEPQGMCSDMTGRVPDTEDSSYELQGALYANFLPQDYAAYSWCKINITGQIRDFRVTGTDDIRWSVNDFPMRAPKLPLADKPLRLGYQFTFAFTTTGTMGAQDYVRITPHFYYQKYSDSGSDAVLCEEVDLYEWIDSGGDTIRWRRLGAVMEAAEVQCTASEADGHIRHWTGTFRLPANTAVVKAGTDLQKQMQEQGVTGYSTIWENTAVFGDKQENGRIMVHFVLRTVKDGREYLDYANLDNADKGYCNMWKQEGFLTEEDIPFGASYRHYGDVAVYHGGRDYMEDYRVVGTH